MTEDRTASEGRRFHLVELVGTGAFGEVYLAEQDSGAGFRRKVAIKLLNDDVRSMKEAGRRMRDEARILGRLAHRNIVAVLDLVLLDERWAIIMDYVPGADLEQLIETLERLGEPFPLAAALEIGGRTLAALDAATHADDGAGGSLSVIHRDIKPSNVRLTPDGEVKVLDFGVARFSLDTREAQTRADGWIGTERYMAPERILCEGDTAAGDVYATVATLVELLLGRPLGRTPVLAERHEPFVAAALAEVRPLIEAEQDVVDAVIDAFARGLATEPGARPTARALSDELEQLARRVRGEALAPFARRIVPRVEEVLGHQREPATGILHERSSSELMRNRSNPTLAVAGESEGAATRWIEATPAPAPARGKGSGAVMLGAVGVLAAVFGVGTLVALGVALWLRTPTESPATGEAPVEVVPVAPAPVAPEPIAIEPPEDPLEPVDGADPDGTPEETTPPIVPPVVPKSAPATPTPAPRAPAPDAPRVSRAQFNLKDASSLTITCGDRDASGTASARITDFPAGACDVRAVFLGQTLSTTTTVDRPRAVTCTVASGALACP